MVLHLILRVINMARPEDRYVKLDTKTLPDARLVYKSARANDVVPTDTELRIISDEKDRLDIIARSVYGSPVEWWRLAAANRRVDGSLHSLPGKEIVIPKKRG